MKSKNLIIIGFFIFSSVASCSLSKTVNKNINGKYFWKHSYEVGESLKLNKNKSFILAWSAGLTKGITTGKWRVEDGYIILNSNLQPQNDQNSCFSLYEKKNTHSNHYTLQIREKNYAKLFYVDCFLLKDSIVVSTFHSDENGICRLKKNKNANKLKVSYMGYHDVVIELKKLKSDSLVIEMKEGLPRHYRFYTESKFKKMGKNIYEITLDSTNNSSSKIYTQSSQLNSHHTQKIK